MGVVQLRQIRTFLETHFAPFIDMSDYATRSEEDRANAILTRSLASFAILVEAVPRRPAWQSSMGPSQAALRQLGIRI